MTQRYLPVAGSNPVLAVDATAGNETVLLEHGFTPGRVLTVRRTDGSANTVTVTATSGDTLNGTTNGSITVPAREEIVFDRGDLSWTTVGYGGGEAGTSDAVIADGSVTAAKLAASVPAAIAADIGTELGLGDAALLDVGSGAGTVAAGNDSRITGAAPLASPTFTGTVTVPAGSGSTDAVRYGQLAKHPDGTTVAVTAARAGSLDIRDYLPTGFVLDGTVDYGTQIRTAVAASGGKALYFPPGTYLFNATSTTMQIPAGARLWADPGTVTINLGTDSAGQYREFARNNGDQVTIEGLTIRRNADFPVVMFPVQSHTGLSFRRVTLDGQRDTFATNYCHGLQFGVQAGTADDILLDRSTFTKLTYGAFQANASTSTTKNIRVRGSRFISNYATDLEFNNPNGTMTGVRVVESVFLNNQTATTGAGFAIGLAFVSDARITGNTISGYNNEAIHVEDYSDDVTIAENTITTSGVAFTGVIQVISGASKVRILNNRISTVGNTTSIGVVNILAGGSGTTPGGRSVIAPRFVTVHGNEITVGGTTKGLYAESVLHLTISGNHFEGPGNVSGGVYSGSFGYAIQIYTGSHTIITGNWVSGFTYGIFPLNSTIAAFGDGSVVSNNVFRRCFLGASFVNAASVTVIGNMFHTCQHPAILSQGGGTTDNVTFTGNQAVACTNPMSIHGVIAVTSNGTAATGAGRTLTVLSLKNTLPIGTVIVFSGGGTLTTTSVANFDATSVVGTVATASIASAETSVAYLPYSTNAAKNRTIANNSDDYYGAAGHGVKIASVAADYRVLGYEGLILATAGGITITLPPAANHRGMAYAVKNTAGSSLTLAAQAGNVDGSSTATIAAAAAARAVSDGTNWWLAA